MNNLSREQISVTFRKALEQGLIGREDTAVMFHDLSFLEERILNLGRLFPHDALHALAVKANPLLRVMAFTRDLQANTGVEAASMGEVRIALAAGYAPSRIVYDSPVKTMQELTAALEAGVHINADNLDELARIDTLRRGGNAGTAGIRINPQVGTGTIAESSVAGDYSKFGVPLRRRKEELLSAFRQYPWLTGVHLHVGSQGCPLEMLVEGVGRLYDLVAEINPARISAGLSPVHIFDIGGGLPVSYFRDRAPVSMEAYVKALEARTPGLFRPVAPFVPPPKIITEFGRWVYTNTGWTVSRVEYIKRDPGINTAMIHVGADLFVRECLNPRDWSHEYSVLDRNGNIKEGLAEAPWNLAGPLCFSGDILAREVPLPEIGEGDYLVVHDTGGYTFSMWSRYNSRYCPKILGYRGDRFEVLRHRESGEDILRFWKGPE